MQPALRNPDERPRLPIQAILRRTPDLPALPTAVMRVIQLTGGSDATSRSVAEAIGLDQSLSSKVLRLANSSFYGLPRQVTSLNDAVIVLGFRTVRHMALIAGTYPWMSKGLKGYDLAPRQLMTHSMAIAVGAQIFARMGQFDADTAFVAGLLADIGKFAISNCIEDKIGLMSQLAEHANMTFEEVERKVVGYSHSEIGAHMAENWNLPAELVDAIRCHHQPGESRHPWLAHVLHLADFVAMTTGCGLGGDGLQYELSVESLDVCRLSAEDLDRVTLEFVTAFEHAESLFEKLM